MVLVYTHKITPRVTYIFRHIFKRILLIPVSFTTKIEEFVAHNGPKLSYTKVPLGNEFFIKSNELLFEQGVNDLEINIQKWDSIPSFFATNKKSTLPFDIFAASFYLITRYEEYLPHVKDVHGRFTAEQSLAYKKGFLEKPLIDIWAYKFLRILKEKFPDYTYQTRQYKYLSTIDVDNAYAYKHKSFIRTFGGFFMDLVKFRLLDVFNRFVVITNIKKDPFDTFSKLLSLKKKYHIETLFFFSVADYTTFDTNVSFSKNASIAHYNHLPVVQYIIIFFMLVAGTNFVLTYFALKGKIQKVLQSEEFRYYLFGIISVSSLIIVIIYFFQDTNLQTTIAHPKVYGEAESAIRHGLFMVTSVVTTTGFVTADFTMWNFFATGIFFALFFTGGSAGSTSGGVKVVRHIVMLKNSFLEFKKALHPNAIIPVRYDGNSVNQTIVFNIISFFIIYMLIFIIGSVTLCLLGLDFVSALGAAASSLGNIGPAIGSVSPVDNFNHLSDAAKWFCSFLMLIGRLELFTVLILFTPFFWRKS